MRGQQTKGQLPNHPSFGIGEAMKFVHDDGMDIFKRKSFGMKQAIKQNLRHDDQHRRLGIDLAISCHQADIVGSKSPANRCGLHFGEFLFGERNQRRGVIGPLLGVKGFKQSRFRDKRFARSGRCADQHSLLRGEPSEERFFLHWIRCIRKLIEIQSRKFIAGRDIRHGGNQRKTGQTSLHLKHLHRLRQRGIFRLDPRRSSQLLLRRFGGGEQQMEEIHPQSAQD